VSLVEKTLEKLQQERRAAMAATTSDAAAERIIAAGSGPGSGPRPEAALRPVSPSKSLRINRDVLRRAGLFPPEEHERMLAAQYLRIKRPLIENALGRGGSRMPAGTFIMVSSALPGDGKTFTSVNLALSIAREKDVTVLLVDADVAKAHISRTLGIDQEPGLLDGLKDGAPDIESMVIGTDIEGLSILPAGRPNEMATELLASERMQVIAARLSARHPNRIVLFDSPPLLLTSEAPALARTAGQIVLVVKAGETPQPAVMDALALLGESQFVGLVFNQSKRSAAAGYGYYGYGDRAAGSSEGPPRAES
jgi:exopolysaccharide/PEP-CTERM locus tyrosine autokinase